VGERVYGFDARAGAAVAVLAEGSFQGSAAKEKRVLMYDLTNPATHYRVRCRPTTRHWQLWVILCGVPTDDGIAPSPADALCAAVNRWKAVCDGQH
jgi:hypothetical protein